MLDYTEIESFDGTIDELKAECALLRDAYEELENQLSEIDSAYGDLDTASWSLCRALKKTHTIK